MLQVFNVCFVPPCDGISPVAWCSYHGYLLVCYYVRWSRVAVLRRCFLHPWHQLRPRCALRLHRAPPRSSCCPHLGLGRARGGSVGLNATRFFFPLYILSWLSSRPPDSSSYSTRPLGLLLARINMTPGTTAAVYLVHTYFVDYASCSVVLLQPSTKQGQRTRAMNARRHAALLLFFAAART